MINFELFIQLQLKISLMILCYFCIIYFLKNQRSKFKYFSGLLVVFFIIYTIIIDVYDIEWMLSVTDSSALYTAENMIMDFYEDELFGGAIEASTSFKFDFTNFILFIYLLFAFIQVLKILFSLIETYGIMRTSKFYKTSHSITIKISNLEQSPFVIGIFKPVIVLPKSSINWDRNKFENVILHEKAHVLNYDFITNLILQCLKIVMIFNPVFLFFYKYITIQRELWCDEYVLLNKNNPTVFAILLDTKLSACAANGS
jgi:beta-lactamase regulating signal transducer with metallopeptidase domain